MSTATAPTIPPRPAKSQNKMPEIPPRPIPKRVESPSRSHYSHSPFNEPLGRSLSNAASSSELNLPARPPSVSLPSIGQEGQEYADMDYEDQNLLTKALSNTSEQTRHIGGNLPIHAPKPSHPANIAKAQVQAVTRTDSSQAAALGVGNAATPVPEDHDLEPLTRLKSKSSFSRPGSSSSSTNRRSSMQFEEEHGPAELGMRVPINPYLGDVQAPSPAPFAEAGHTHHHGHPPHSAGHGQRKHHRTRSGRDVLLPPDSYGLHGHGVVFTDKFEKDWYAKHPDALQRDKEDGYYHGIGGGRGESALSSDELNKLVRETTNRGAGFGASPNVPAYPDEQIGYMASENYSSRVASPNTTGGGLYKLHSNPSHPTIESPLRKTSFPGEVMDRFKSRELARQSTGASDKAIESEAEDEPVHVGTPARKYNKITGGQESMRETDNLGPTGGNDGENGGYIVENGYGVPILASDEVAKEQGGEFLQPAVPPHADRRSSMYDEYGSGSQTPRSRPSSRPSSMHGAGGLSRFISHPNDSSEHVHTPLEDVEEYEPLFPDDDGNKRPMTAADRFKQRPGTLKHRFPSQDIWEDAPNSQLYVATVSTPDLPQEQKQKSTDGPSSAFETPEQEGARKGETSEAEKAKLVPKEERLAKSRFAPHLRDDMPTRPNMQNRFPSQDIWEDSPDSMNLVTTVSTPPTEDVTSPEAQSKPTIPSRPVNRTKMGDNEASVPATQPTLPARPPKRLHQVPPADAKLTSLEKQTSPVEGKKAPVLPDRPKPQIPARPAKRDASDDLTKTTSAGSTASDETGGEGGKVKPTVPARPAVGSKIANLRAGFMSDLDKRFQLRQQGPSAEDKQPEPEAEEETEKAPLSDARKGRARGPQRRKPAASPSAQPSASGFSLVAPQSVWHISNEDDRLTVHSHGEISSNKASAVPDVTERQKTGGDVEEPKAAQVKQHISAEAPNTLAPPLSTNTAGEATDPPSIDTADATPKSEKGNPLGRSPATLAKHIDGASDATSPLAKASTPEDLAAPPETSNLEKNEPEPTVDEKALEELTAKADGKEHVTEEPTA